MRKKRNKILISILISTILLATIIMYNTPLHKQKIPTRFIAGESMGFDLGPGNINFGLIIPGRGTSRDLTITNTHDKPTITKIKSSGEISDYIIVSENNFRLQPQESKNITFTCFPSKDIELREYSGKIIIITKKTNFFS